MKISVMAYSFASLLASGEITVPGVIRYLRELGIDAVELMDGFVRDDDLASIQAALAECGSHVACYDVRGDFATTDATECQAAVANVRRGFERARICGTRQVMLVPGPPPSDMSPDAARACFAEGTKACLPDARRLGLTVSVENLGGQALVCGTSDHLSAIRDAVGLELNVTYDAGNFLLANEDALSALDRLLPWVVHVHLKDWTVAPSRTALLEGEYRGLDGRVFAGVALGEGVVDLSSAVARLRSGGYAGYLSVEYEGTGNPREAVRRGVAYARSLLEDRSDRPAGHMRP